MHFPSELHFHCKRKKGKKNLRKKGSKLWLVKRDFIIFEPYSLENFTIKIENTVILLLSKQNENWNIYETMTYNKEVL